MQAITVVALVFALLATEARPVSGQATSEEFGAFVREYGEVLRSTLVCPKRA